MPHDIIDIVRKHGATAKAVRAICRARGWRHNAQGAPQEWYEAWSDGLAAEFSAALEAK